MAVDYYLKLEGIEGESQDKDHKNEIDILSWVWGMNQSGTTHMGSGSAGGRVNVQDLALVMLANKATPALIRHCCTGKHIPSGTLTCYKASGDSRVKFFVLELERIIVASYGTGGTDEADRQIENTSLNFGRFKVVYGQQMADGSAGPTAEVAWDIAAHEAT